MLWHLLVALWDCLIGNPSAWKQGKIIGTVVLVRKHVLDLPDYVPSCHNQALDLPRHAVSFRLVSSTHTDPATGRGKVGKEAYLLEASQPIIKVGDGESVFKISFEWDDNQGIPGAVIVRNNHESEFFLKTLTLESVPGKGRVHFVCNSWVNPKCSYDRVFFTNDTYLPSQMPTPLKQYRDQELVCLRGDEIPGQLDFHDRVYDYDVYNDLGDTRPILGGPDYPYPRRGRTGRGNIKGSNYESRLNMLQSLDIYVPRDEQLHHLKLADSFAFALQAIGHAFFPGVATMFDKDHEFDSLQYTIDLYNKKDMHPLHSYPNLRSILAKNIHSEFIKAWLTPDGGNAFSLPMPQVIKVDQSAWTKDEEFAREMLAGTNPVMIKLLQEFPPTSKLNPTIYGNQKSTITKEHIEKHLAGFTVSEALEKKRLFILDYHDIFMPYLNKFNSLKGNYIYATRTILFLQDDGTLKPLAIELSVPHPDGVQSKVYTPVPIGTVEGSIWQLAKAYVVVNDSGYHQLISHWLNTHAVIEPFIIATHRQLSVTHPIHKLMSPHYRDTMKINALARQSLVNADGLIEQTLFPQKYSMEMTSDIYRNWKLTEQGLPDDLIKRGIAIEDPSKPHKLDLLIKDYPYAVDGLAVWSAIESWVSEYCSIYYPNDLTVKSDTELQSWWKEIREIGHGDKRDETWWPTMQTVKELTKTCTTIVWVASALHAAVNFASYPYGGYQPNRPTISRQKMPTPETKEYKELEENWEKVFLRTITSRIQTLLGISLLEVLSRHSSDEVYLGQRDTPEWTSEERALKAFDKFHQELVNIEDKIRMLNKDPDLRNRNGPVNFPYTLLYPNTSEIRGTGGMLPKEVPKGIPNSISI